MFEDKICFSLNVKIVDGNKKLIGIPKEWQTKTKEELQQKMLKSHKNKAIVCGKKNNITIIDFDENAMQYFNQFESIMNTFIETSTRGFKHAYFVYDEDLKNHDKDIKNKYDIDILNDGSFCIMTNDNNDKEVSLIPKELKDFLLGITDCDSTIDLEDDLSDIQSEYESEDNDDDNDDSKKIRDLVNIIDVKYSENRDDWIKIGMCVKQLVNDDDEAFDIWNDFSKICKNKYSLKESKKQWSSFKNVGKYSIKTLFYYAKDNKKEMKEWNKLYKENNPITINKVTKLNKFNLNDEYCFCTLKDYLFYNKFDDINSAIEYLELNLFKVCVRVNEYMITKQPMDDFNNIHKVEVFNRGWKLECLVKYYQYNEKTDSNRLIQKPLKDFLELYPHLINSFYKVNSEFITEGQILNEKEFYITEQFKATYIPNINESQMNMIQPLLDLVKVVYCNNDEDLYNMIMMLFSFWVCNPNEKSGKCLILTGAQGTGKTTIIDFFSEFIFGNKICMFLKGFKELLSDKNGHLSGKKFVNINETRSKKGDYFTNFDDLKTLISDKIISIRGMFKETKNEKSSMELVVTTNNPNCCPIEDNDRKYIVLKVNPIYMQKDKEFWEPFRNQVFNQTCADIFYSYLINMNTTISKWRSVNFTSLNTELKNDLNKLNKNSVELFLNDLKEQISDMLENKNKKTKLLNGTLLYNNMLNEESKYIIKLKDNKILVSPSSLFDGYKCYCKHNGEMATSNKYFGFDLKNKYNIVQTKSGSNRWYTIADYEGKNDNDDNNNDDNENDNNNDEYAHLTLST